MSVWAELEQEITAGDVPAVLERVVSLDDKGRREVARALPGYVRSRDGEFWRERGGVELRERQNTALKAAGAACLPPSSAAAWLLRGDLRSWGVGRSLEKEVVRAAESRPVSWRADVGRRLAAKLRLRDMSRWNREGEALWEGVARLVVSAGEAPPTDDAFVVGWLAWRRTTPGREDAFFPGLVPSIFEAEGVGAALADEQVEADGSWVRKLLGAAAEEGSAVSRDALLDGCVRRFLRGGEARDLLWFVRLHQALAPTVEEAAARARDYVRLLPSAPGNVAELAFTQVKAVDGEGRLEDGLFAEAVEALLFRPEARLVKGALVWLDRTARARGRESAVVGFAASLFGHERHELRERAVKLAVKHGAKADPLTAETVREAAAVLPGTLLPQITAVFGDVEAAEPEGPPVLYAPAPTDLPGPITSPAELFEQSVLMLRNPAMSWAEMERLVAGLVTSGPAIVDDLQRYVENEGTRLLERSHLSHLFGPALILHSLLDRRTSAEHLARRARKRRLFGRGRRQDAASFAEAARLEHRRRMISQHRPRGAEFPALSRLLHLRFVDAAAHIGAPALLATPTSSTGHVDPEVFAARLRILEEAGDEPGRYDLEQALLRLPAGTGRVPGLDGLSSPAAAQAREWLASGGFRAPDLGYGFVTVRRRLSSWYSDWTEVPYFHARAVCTSALDSARLLGTVDPPEGEETGVGHHSPQIPWWPASLPSHRELTAAHLLHHTATCHHDPYDQGAVLPAFADTTGPTGPATAAVLLQGLGAADAPGRAGAVDALLSLAAQNALPAADLGRLLPAFLEAGSFPLTRLLPPLTEAVQAGAPLWPFFAEAVPALLPAPGTPARTGLAPFLALATTTAELHRIRTPLPALTAWTPSSPASRPAKEAARLHRTLTTP